MLLTVNTSDNWLCIETTMIAVCIQHRPVLIFTLYTLCKIYYFTLRCIFSQSTMDNVQHSFSAHLFFTEAQD